MLLKRVSSSLSNTIPIVSAEFGGMLPNDVSWVLQAAVPQVWDPRLQYEDL